MGTLRQVVRWWQTEMIEGCSPVVEESQVVAVPVSRLKDSEQSALEIGQSPDLLSIIR